LLVFLNRHVFGNNYLYPFLNDVLSFKQVCSYWALDLVFAPPWLALYLLGYALIYTFLAVRKRETWSIYFFALISMIYYFVNLRDLASYGEVLFFLNCIGLFSIFGLRFCPAGWNWRLLSIPCASVVLIWIVMQRMDIKLAKIDPYFWLVVAISLALAGIGLFSIKGTPLYPSASHFIPFYGLCFFLFTNWHYPFSSNYNHLLIYAFSLSQYFIEEAVFVFLLLCAGYLSGLIAIRCGRGVFDFFATALFSLAFIDLALLKTLGTRLEWNVLAMSNSFILVWRTIQPFLPQALAGLAVLGIFYFTGVSLFSRILKFSEQDLESKKAATIYYLAGFVLISCAGIFIERKDKVQGFSLTRLAATSPLLNNRAGKKLDLDLFVQTASNLNLFSNMVNFAEGGSTNRQLPNVFLIVLESSYNKYLSMFGGVDETQPLLKKHRDRMELFPNFYSNFPDSFHARFSILSGQYATREYVSYLNPKIEVSSMPEILRSHGYFTSVFQSDSREFLRFADYISHRVDLLHDSDSMPGREQFRKVSWGIEEEATMQAIKSQFTNHSKSGNRFFLSYFPVAPHMPFDSGAKKFKVFPTGFEKVTRNFAGRYKNELLYMDWIVTSLLDTLEDLRLLDNTIVFITNDHGELVGDDPEASGNLGHGWSTRPELCNSPLIIMNPSRKGYRLNSVLGSHVDLLPTLLQLLQIPKPRDLYPGSSLFDVSAGAQRVVYLNSNSQRAVIRGLQYLWEETPPAAGAKAANLETAFQISFQDSKTIFTPLPLTTNVSDILDNFERFQDSYIRFYSDYKRQLLPNASP